MIALAAERDCRAAFNLCRSAGQGPFSPQESQLIELLTPHLRRSIALGFRIDAYLAMRQAAFSILEQFTDGLIILNRSAHVLFANVAARRFEADGALRLRPPISTSCFTASRRLSALIKAALRGAVGGTMSFQRNADGQLLTLLVSSIRSKDIGRLSDAGLKDPAVLLMVVDAANRRSIPLDQIMEAYGLTHAEARVALAVSEVEPDRIAYHLSRKAMTAVQGITSSWHRPRLATHSSNPVNVMVWTSPARHLAQ
jgi:hypothetical protein